MIAKDNYYLAQLERCRLYLKRREGRGKALVSGDYNIRSIPLSPAPELIKYTINSLLIEKIK
jgi:hypothetical protein